MYARRSKGRALQDSEETSEETEAEAGEQATDTSEPIKMMVSIIFRVKNGREAYNPPRRTPRPMTRTSKPLIKLNRAASRAAINPPRPRRAMSRVPRTSATVYERGQ